MPQPSPPKFALNASTSTAQDIRQLSHMELMYEGARPEPRLRRVLGHASTYESASRWCREHSQRKGVGYVNQGTPAETAAVEVAGGGGRQTPNGVSTKGAGATQVRRLLSLSEFQAVVQSQLQHRQLVVMVDATEVDADSDDDSDSSCESDSSYSSDDDDDGEDGDGGGGTLVGSRQCRYAHIESVDYLTNALSLRDGDENGKVVQISTCRGGANEEQGDGWKPIARAIASSC